jgi:chemotaxis methyl-accepting protein methylase
VLAGQVGARGRVLATDIDPRWLDGTPGIEVLQHDVGAEPAPDGPFDLVHARLLLVHVPDREAALRRMAAALRPGGWLVVEEADPGLQPLVCLENTGPAEELANRLKSDSAAHGSRRRPCLRPHAAAAPPGDRPG